MKSPEIVRAAIATAVCLAASVGPLAAQVPDTAAAQAALREFQAACRKDEGRLWGRSLCGPLILVDPKTRFAVANETPPAGAFTPRDGHFLGRVPEEFRAFANTATDWSGRRWSVVLLPLPAERFDRLALLIHEAFHRIQPDLALGGGDAANPHLDERDGRYLYRLEVRALAAAATAPEAEHRARLRDAVTLRAVRTARYRGADTLEPKLELHEGLAEYTGVRLAMEATGAGPEPVVAAARAFESRPSYVRASGYGTGLLLGLALDRVMPGWHRRLGPGGPAALLREAVGPVEGGDIEAIAARYDGATLARFEDDRARERSRRLAAYRALLVDGPTIALPDSGMMRNFNPSNLVPLGDEGTVYPTGTFQAPWGSLVVDSGGARLDPNTRRLWIGTPAELDSTATTIAGAGWTLKLSPGWALKPAARKGDWIVSR